MINQRSEKGPCLGVMHGAQENGAGQAKTNPLEPKPFNDSRLSLVK